MAEPHDLTALEQAAAIARGELSSVELVEHYLPGWRRSATRSARSSPSRPDLARQAARAADAVPVEGAVHCTAYRPRSRT